MGIVRERYQQDEEVVYKVYNGDNIIKEGKITLKDKYVGLSWDVQKSLPPNVKCIITRPSTGETKEIIYKYCFSIHAPKFNKPAGNYRIDVSWDGLERQLESMVKYNSQSIIDMLNPEFQRGHVWNEEQQIAYVEYILKGGNSGKEVYFNRKGWNSQENESEPIYCIDGLQRITAVRRFMNNEFPVFTGVYNKDTTGPDMLQHSFSLHILDFQTQEEVLQWYIDMNAQGTPHTKEELDRVRELKEKIKCT